MAGERPISRAVKSNKDVQQAAALLLLLRERDEEAVQEALADMARRGPGWVKRLAQGKKLLERAAPGLEVAEWLRV